MAKSALKTSTRRQAAAAPRELRSARASATAPPLDRLIHERMRLGIVSALAANESLTFSDLKSLVESTDGNLSVHARKLEDAGYISCTKSFDGRVPKTEYKLTTAGRRALENYLNHMETLIQKMRNT
ncbi:MAG: transcriptional regulator [Acidobacteriota bacterium]|nr:transcriptional regulator [Acidobacteriota bacterium]